MPRNAPQHDQLLLDTLRDLRGAVDRVDAKQDLLQDRMTEMVQPLEVRLTKLEHGQSLFTQEVKREARKWGAVGGIATAATACVTAVVGIFKMSAVSK